MKFKLQCVGCVTASFGLGVLFTLFLPRCVLVYLLALIIIAAGVMLVI